MADYITMKQIPGGTVTAKDDRILNDANIASSGVIYGCQVSFLGENMIHMNAGYGIIKGGIFEIEDHTEYIDLPASGTKLGQIYIHVDFSADDKIQIVKEVADSRHAMVQNPNANFVNGIYEIQLCTFTATATNITDVVQTFTVVSNQVLDSLQEILANTTPGLKAGALALKSVAESVNGIDIRYDPVTQKPQWKERGADSWENFSGSRFYLIEDGELVNGTTESLENPYPSYAWTIAKNGTKRELRGNGYGTNKYKLNNANLSDYQYLHIEYAGYFQFGIHSTSGVTTVASCIQQGAGVNFKGNQSTFSTYPDNATDMESVIKLDGTNTQIQIVSGCGYNSSANNGVAHLDIKNVWLS